MGATPPEKERFDIPEGMVYLDGAFSGVRTLSNSPASSHQRAQTP